MASPIEPAARVSGIFGDAPLIRSATMKSTSLASNTAVFDRHIVRTRAWIVGGPATVHGKVAESPAVVVVIAMGLQDVPLSRLTSGMICNPRRDCARN
jgi:hypothetical protein